jgi:hypothetical protein
MFSIRTLKVAVRAFFFALTAACTEACAHRAAASMTAEAIDNLLLRMDVFSFNESCTGRAPVPL